MDITSFNLPSNLGRYVLFPQFNGWLTGNQSLSTLTKATASKDFGSEPQYSLFFRGCQKLLMLFMDTFFKNIYIYWLCYYSCPIPPPHSTPSCPPPPSRIPPYSSCPWVIFISSLASTFPILFLPSPFIFYLPFMLFILCTFPPSLPLSIPYG